MRMNRAASTVVLWCSACTAWPVNADPQSNDCQKALAALDARESELARSARADAAPRIPTDARWQALRRQAARACLGREGAASAPLPHSALPPIAVPPVAVPAAPADPPQRRTPPPLPGYKPPVSVMSCDPLGCWTSDGARLPHTGRNPLDARVRCSIQGQIVVCL
jgi:hypothetical protein